MRRKYEVVPISIYGTPIIGVYIFTNNKYTFIPPDMPPKLDDIIRSTLGTEVIRVTIGKTPLLGIFMAGNDNGIIVPDIATDDELKLLRSLDLNVQTIETRFTAVSNLVLCNNRTCLVSPILEKENLKIIQDTLNTETYIDTICKSYLVGSLAVANSRGVLVSADAEEEDLKKLRDMFKLPVDVGTINRGKTMLRSGLVANDYGALVGDDTTGFEIVRIIQVLGHTE
ncbi:MAG: translation initiation factor IF-6 [Crenarchaeota archaeon]|nr:translation initiation factor IF-6 [Thermoproteota archaeon]